ncbi:hypothetical protein F4860DRAFT_482799 [Xylaria cubensis]|nr:hypothetical protein F4860DRAFT_482799 [Xylaria cubensis]
MPAEQKRAISGQLDPNMGAWHCNTPPSASPSKKHRSSSPSPSLQPLLLHPAPPPAVITDLGTHIRRPLTSLFEALPDSHAIFGTPAAGLVRLPWKSSRANGQCWHNVCIRLANSVVAQMGREVPAGSCWLSAVTTIEITQPQGAHNNTILRKTTTTRVLAFLAAPTPDNWVKLCATPTMPRPQRPIDSPFVHRCARGSLRAGMVGCINYDHGHFDDRDANESYKGCANGALALCPGHGKPPKHCIFTHDNGWPRPCRMVEDHVPKCTCERPCYQPTL